MTAYRSPNGPTSMVRQYAASRPGCVISWSEAQAAYKTGRVRDYANSMVPGAAHHKMSISNLLRRHFTRVEGAKGLYVLNTSMTNHDHEEDAEELRAFHAIHGSDEFGMSVHPLVAAIQRRASRDRAALSRMSDIGSDSGKI